MKIFGCWYNEYKGSIRLHDYFSLMVNQFPILVIRKYDDPHEGDDWWTLNIGILGFTFHFYKNHNK